MLPQYHTPTDAAARGKVRQWKTAASHRFARFCRVFNAADTKNLAGAFVYKSGRGRRRAYDRLDTMLAAHGAIADYADLTGKYPYIIWSILQPATTPEFYGVAVDYVLIGGWFKGRRVGLWTLEVFDHALERLVQRDPRAHIAEVVMEAHHRVLVTSMKTAEPCIDNDKRRFLVPAGSGAFICEMNRVTDGQLLHLHVRAKTWIHQDQFFEWQETAIAADTGAEGERLGDAWLVPHGLKFIVKDRETGKWQAYTASQDKMAAMARKARAEKSNDNTTTTDPEQLADC